MAKMKTSFKEFMEKHGRSESGFTMAEILVAIALLAVLTAVVTSTIINATQTSDKFSRGTMNEDQLLNAVSLVTRDISLAREIKYASSTALAVNTLEEGKKSSVFYFYWTGSVDSIPSNDAFAEVKNNSSRISSQPGIVEYRIVNSDTGNPTVRTLIEGYNPGGNVDYPLFTYYDGKNSEILLDASNPPQVAKDRLPEIRRVELHFTSYIDSRNNAMELHTSASPRFLGTALNNVAGVDRLLDKPATPLLYGDLTPRTNTAKLSWTPIAGATGYTVYRTNRNQTPLTQVASTTANPFLDDPNLAWGETYQYYVVAQGFSGDSAPSTKINLRVTPQPTQFINIDPTRGQDGSSITNYTVARNLNNQLTWAVSTGENIKYRLYTVNGAVKTQIYDGPLTTFTHTGRSYGDVTRYVVVAYNDPIQGFSKNNPSAVTGGTSVDSPPVDLVSPPKQPTLSGDARNDLTAIKTATATNVLTITNAASNPTAKGYEFRYGSSSAGAADTLGSKSAASTWSDQPGWGTTRYYSATAYNDAGSSPVTTPPVKLDQIPGPFTISSLSNNTGYGNVIVQGGETGDLASVNQKGTMEASWTASAGKTSYNVDRWIANGLGARQMSKTVMDWESDKSGITTENTNFPNSHPGVIYGVQVQAVAANGLTRAVTKTLLTRPDVPRHGIAEGICLANNSGPHAVYTDADARPLSGYADYVKVSYLQNGNASKTAVTVPITSSIGAFQETPLYVKNSMIYQNIISRNAVPDASADFGTGDTARTSYPLTLGVEILAAFTGCSPSGKAVSTAIAPVKNGSSWVVPYDVCYGYIPNHDYSQYYMDPNNETAKGYVYGDTGDGFNYSMVKNYRLGCIWRLHPKTGREPYWDSVG
jgi:prepilin-type N-terminal cleavage/methylation domain-containing protein